MNDATLRSALITMKVEREPCDTEPLVAEDVGVKDCWKQIKLYFLSPDRPLNCLQNAQS